MDLLESAALGAAIIKPACAEAVVSTLRRADFTDPFAAGIFDAMENLLSDGFEITTVSLQVEAERLGMERQEVGEAIAAMVVETPAVSTIGTTLRLIQERTRNRELIHGVAEVSELLNSNVDPEQIISRMRSIVERDAGPVSIELPDDFFSYDDLKAEISARHADNLDWVIPGMMRRRWRAILVATEGAAKSTILRQAVLMCAAGRHPFLPEVTMRPCNTLTIDAENPLEVVEHQFDLITNMAKLPPSDGRAKIWACEGGMNLRKRKDQNVFEAVVEASRPDLVTLGPIYKLGLRDGDDWDEAATELLTFLDRMRVKYNFAIMLEHHAPQATSDGRRDIRPFGSSVWLRWPEFGIKFAAQERDELNQPHVVRIGYWRPPRLNSASWPTHLTRSTIGAPWIGTWPDHTWDRKP